MKTTILYLVLCVVLICGGGGVCGSRDNANLRYCASLKVSNVGDSNWDGDCVGLMTAEVTDMNGDPIQSPNMGLDFSQESWHYNDGWWYYDGTHKVQTWCVSRSNGSGQFECRITRSFDNHYGNAYSECYLSVPNRNMHATLWGGSYSDADCTQGQPWPVLGWYEEKISPGPCGTVRQDHYATGPHTIRGGQFYSSTGSGQLSTIQPRKDKNDDYEELSNRSPEARASLSAGGDQTGNLGFAITAEGYQAQVGSQGQGYAMVLDSITPSNSADPDSMFLHGRPIQYSWTIALPIAKDLSDRVYTARVSTQAQPDGIYLDVRPVDNSDDNMIWTFDTDEFVIMDSEIAADVPEEYTMYDQWTVDGSDPNSDQFNVDDPNFLLMYDPNRIVVVKPILMGIQDANDVLSTQIIFDAPLLADFLPYWLTENEIGDLSGDGWVDMIDFSML